MENNKVRIKFEATNEFGNAYIQENNVELVPGVGLNFIDEMGRLLNVFLKQMGYHRENNFIFMEDVTEEELEALYDFLWEYRRERGGENEE